MRYLNLALCHKNLQNVGAADMMWEKCFDNIEQLERKYTAFTYFAGYCKKRGWYKEAIDICLAILELESIDEMCLHSCHFHLFCIYGKCGDFKNQLKHSVLAWEFRPHPIDVDGIASLLFKTMAELGLSKIKKAKKTFKMVIEFTGQVSGPISKKIRELIQHVRLLCKDANKMTKRKLRKCIDALIDTEPMEPCEPPKWVRRMASVISKKKCCAYCGNQDPRTIFMICTGCEKARYCNDDCYKKHWKKHKIHCKK